jgi:LysM repeat protein
LWPAVRSTPLVLEPSRGRTGPLPVSASRTGGQTLLVALMVLAFLVLIIARTGTPSSPGPSPASPGASIPLQTLPAQAASGVPGPSVPVLPSASVAASPGPSAISSATASAGAPSPSSSVVRRYKVRSGDTLYGIAARFGTTVNAIEAANGITAQGVIRVGQVLVIP